MDDIEIEIKILLAMLIFFAGIFFGVFIVTPLFRGLAQDAIISPARLEGNVISTELPETIELKSNCTYEIVIPKDWATTDNLTIKIREIK